MSGTVNRVLLRLTALILLFTGGFFLITCNSGSGSRDTITGFVLSGDEPIGAAEVTIFSTGTSRGVELLGTDLTDETGFFRIGFRLPREDEAVIYVTAQPPILALSVQNRILINDSVRLATVLGRKPIEDDIVINERTTVATAYAMAQFLEARLRPGGASQQALGLDPGEDAQRKKNFVVGFLKSKDV